MTILFLCQENSARAQMAAGLAKKFLGRGHEIYSSGHGPISEVHPIAVDVMNEVGVDISEPQSVYVHNALLSAVDLVISLSASESLEQIPQGVRHLHWPIPDPEAGRRTYGEKVQRFREVRELIQLRLRIFAKENE